MDASRWGRRGPCPQGVVGLLIALVLALSACTAGSTGPSGGPEAGKPAARELTIGAMAEPTSLDPTADAAVAGSQALLYNVYETLLKVDGEGRLRPLLAKAWDLSEDRRTYTFTLNTAARFADGSPVNVDAVAKNIERIRNENVAAKLKTAMSVVESTRPVDDITLAVTLTRPSMNWLYEMASTAGIIINPTGFGQARTASAGSGPFAVERWTPGDSIRLARNDAYWGTPPRFDAVTFRYFRDANALNATMLAGQLDIIADLQAPDALAQFEDPARFQVLQGSTNAEVVLGLNNSRPALSDVRVRRALTMAIDKKALLETTWFGKGTVLGSMAVPTDPYYEDLSAVNAYNPDEARRLLAEAGYPKLTLQLRPAARPYATRAAQFVASQLEAVGVTTTVEELQFPARWLDTVYNKADYDLTIVSHNEPRDLVTFTNPNYYWRYDNPEFNEVVARADAGTEQEYVTGMRRAAHILADDAAAIWLYSLPNLVVTRPGITGVPVNASSLSFDVTTIASA